MLRVVRLHTTSYRLAVAGLSVFAVLFAPAADRWLRGSTQSDPAPVEARVLAPTIREAVAAASPKQILRQLPKREPPSRAASLAGALASSGAAAQPVWAFLADSDRREPSQRLTVLGEPPPRAPPWAQAA
jgi:hypothetical protein